MVCEHSQNEAFQKILLNKIEKLRKQLEKAENDLDEQMLKNEALEAGNKKYKEKYLQSVKDRIEGNPLRQPSDLPEKLGKVIERLEKEKEETKVEYWEKGWQNGKEDCYAEYDEGHALKEENKKLKAELSRVQKERNYLGDYQGGATSEEEEEEADYKLHLKGEERVLPNGVVLIT